MALFNFKRKDVTPENDNRKKRAIVRYFEILISKFSKLVLLNLAYFACLIPMICGVILLICGIFEVSPEMVETFYFLHLIVWISSKVVSFSAPLAIILFLASLIVYGPLTAGLTYCARNIATGRHIWISDLFTRAKRNFKQGIALGVIDIVLMFSLVMYAAADLSAVQGGMLLFYQIMRIAAFVIALIYFVARFYTYSIAVTFELSIKDIFKNSLIFCVLGFFKNLLAILICFIAVFSFISTPKIDIVLIGTLLFSLCRYSVLFSTYPIIDEYMLKPTQKPEEESEEA